MYIIQTLEVLALLFQRQPVADVLQNRCKTCNFVKRILQNRRFLVNLAKFLRTALFIEQPCWLLLLFLCFAPGSALAFVSCLNKLFQQRMVPPIYHCFVFKILNYMFSSIYNDTWHLRIIVMEFVKSCKIFDAVSDFVLPLSVVHVFSVDLFLDIKYIKIYSSSYIFLN